jgi:beta-lactamase regulating signal transducer with metallopeptidase domain
VAEWIDWLNHGAEAWAGAFWRACWQGGLAILLVWLTCRLLPRMSGAARSRLWRVAYLKLLVALGCAVAVELPLLPAQRPPSLSPPHAMAGPSHRINPSASVVSRVPSLTPTGEPRSHRPAPTRPGPKALLLLLWLLGALGSLAHAVREYARTRRLRHRCIASTDDALCERVERLASDMGLRSPPDLLVCPGRVPLAVGVFRLAILLPAHVQAAQTETDWILAHELAHLKRGDLVWNILPLAANILFFFHPLLWLAHREWLLAREAACDEIAIRLTDAPPAGYARMLVRMTVGSARVTSSVGAAGVIGPRRLLETRLLMLHYFACRSGSSTYRDRIRAGLAALLILIGVVPWRLTAPAAQVTRSATAGSTRSERLLAGGVDAPAKRRSHEKPSTTPIQPQVTSPDSPPPGEAAVWIGAPRRASWVPPRPDPPSAAGSSRRQVGRASERDPANRAGDAPTINAPVIQGNEGPELEGAWRLILPAGFERRVVLTSTGPNQFRLTSERPLNGTGVYQHHGGRLILVEPDDPRLAGFEWEVGNAGTLRLVAQPDPAKVGASYLGALLLRERQALQPDSRPPQQPERLDLSGQWLLTLPAGYEQTVTLRWMGENRYFLAPSGLNPGGVYEFRDGQLVLLVPRTPRLAGFEWSVENAGRLVLVDQPDQARTGADYLGATLTRPTD